MFAALWGKKRYQHLPSAHIENPLTHIEKIINQLEKEKNWLRKIVAQNVQRDQKIMSLIENDKLRTKIHQDVLLKDNEWFLTEINYLNADILQLNALKAEINHQMRRSNGNDHTMDPTHALREALHHQQYHNESQELLKKYFTQQTPSPQPPQPRGYGNDPNLERVSTWLDEAQNQRQISHPLNGPHQHAAVLPKEYGRARSSTSDYSKSTF